MDFKNQMEGRFAAISKLAARDGVDAELLVEAGETLRLSANEGKIEKFEASQSQVGGFRVIQDGVEGYAWTESLESADLESAYQEALLNARFAKLGRPTAGNEQVSLYTATASTEDASLFNDSQDRYSIEEKMDRARALEREAKAVDLRIVKVPYNAYIESKNDKLVFNTKGVRAAQRSSQVYYYAYCLAKQGDETRAAGEDGFTRNADQVKIRETAQAAAAQTLEKLGAVSPETGVYPVILRNDIAADFFLEFKQYFSAKAVAEKTSLFADELGQTIASPLLTIIDEPQLVEGVGNRSFDSEGAPTARTVVVKNGKLESFLTNTVYAERLNLRHTANAERSARGVLDIDFANFVIAAGDDDFLALVRRYPKVIVLTKMQGYHAGFNKGSGEFSLSAEGELWENGERVKPLKGFVVSGSIRQLFKDIEMVSNRTRKTVGRALVPDLLIRALSIAGSA